MWRLKPLSCCCLVAGVALATGCAGRSAFLATFAIGPLGQRAISTAPSSPPEGHSNENGGGVVSVTGGGPTASGGGGASSISGGSDPGFPAIVSLPDRYAVSDVAGSTTGGLALGSNAQNATFEQVSGLLRAPDGTVFVSDPLENQIRGIPASGPTYVVAGAGDGTPGYLGDNIPAIADRLDAPLGLVRDALSGAILVCDSGNGRIRCFVPGGRIYTVVGGGSDGSDTVSRALDAALQSPCGIALDGQQNIYFTERASGRVRVCNAAGQVSTLATFSPSSLGPIAVSNVGDRVWVGVGSAVRLLRPKSSPALQTVPVLDATGTVVTGVAFDQQNKLYVSRTAATPFGESGTLVQRLVIGSDGFAMPGASPVTIAGTGGTSTDNLTYGVSATPTADARNQLLAGAGLCALSIDLNSTADPTVPAGDIYLGNSYYDTGTGIGWGEVCKLAPSW